MQNVPYVKGNAPSEAAAKKLRTQIVVANAWIDEAASVGGATAKDVRRALGKDDSGVSARQSALKDANVIFESHMRREDCAVHFLVPGLTPEAAKERFVAWLSTEGRASRVASTHRKRVFRAVQEYIAHFEKGSVNFAQQTTILDELGTKLRQEYGIKV